MDKLEELVEFIQSSNLPTWNNLELILKELETNQILVSVTENKITGCLLVEEKLKDIFNCNFLFAKTKKDFVILALKFKKKFPCGKVLFARRRQKQISYSKDVVEKVIKTYVKEFI